VGVGGAVATLASAWNQPGISWTVSATVCAEVSSHGRCAASGAEGRVKVRRALVAGFAGCLASGGLAGMAARLDHIGAGSRPRRTGPPSVGLLQLDDHGR
jgi:hypothetical protein